MKIIASSLLVMLIAQQSSAQSFEDSFQAAFVQSINGLVSFKGEQHGNTWVYATPIEEMEQSEIVFIPDLKRHALRITRTVENEGTGMGFAGRYNTRIQNALPQGDYAVTENSSTKYAGNVCRTFKPANSGNKNQPTIEIGTVQKGDHYEFQILLIEPEVKNQYTPKF